MKKNLINKNCEKEISVCCRDKKKDNLKIFKTYNRQIEFLKFDEILRNKKFFYK